MKKIFSLFLILAGIISTSAFALANDNELNTKFEALAKRVVELHMNAIDNDAVMDSYLDATSDVNVYLAAKEALSTKKTNKNNYQITTTVIESKVINDTTYFKVNAKASWKYDGATFESGYGKVIDVIIDNKSGKITDIYDHSNAFDLSVRGEIDILNEQERLTSTTANSAAQKYSAKIKKSSAEIEESIANDKANLTSRILTRNQTAYSWIDHDAVVSWARANYNKSLPTSGRVGVVDYYDFSQISNAWDCTNFVSHSLLAGGARIHDTRVPSTGWYYWSTADRSHSWSGVNELHNFATNNTTCGPGGYSMTWSESYTDWSEGDIMQFYNGNIWRHSTVITGWVYYANGNLIPVVTGRSSRYEYNNNEEATEVYSGYAKRILHLYNYGA